MARGKMSRFAGLVGPRVPTRPSPTANADTAWTEMLAREQDWPPNPIANLIIKAPKVDYDRSRAKLGNGFVMNACICLPWSFPFDPTPALPLKHP
jgi:hypothetical protein